MWEANRLYLVDGRVMRTLIQLCERLNSPDALNSDEQRALAKGAAEIIAQQPMVAMPSPRGNSTLSQAEREWLNQLMGKQAPKQ